MILSILKENSRLEILSRPANGSDFLPALTSLRFFAALMIVAEHWFESSNVARYHSVFSVALDQGVSCFFVLSGFILSYAYPRLNEYKDIVRFSVARFARIWPAHLLAMIIAGLLLHINFHQPISAKLPWITFANLAMVHGWILSQPYYFSFNMPSWSISTELFFYLCFPFLIYKWDRTWKLKIVIGMAGVLFCMATASLFLLSSVHTPSAIILQRYLYISPLARVMEFILGMVVFRIYTAIADKNVLFNRSKTASLFEIVSLSIVVANLLLMPLVMKCFCGDPFKDSILYWLRFSGGAPFYGMLILMLAIGKGVVARMLSTPVLVKLGELSYSIYLFHWIILRALSLNGFGVGSGWINFLLYFTLVLAAASLNYVFIESYCRRKIVAISHKLLDSKVGIKIT